MPETARKYFGNVTTTGPDSPWIDQSEVLAEAGFSYCQFATATSDYLVVGGPLAGPDVPVDAVITEIEIRVSNRDVGNPGEEITFRDVTITGGSDKGGGTFNHGPSYGLDVFSGNLAYWGLTQQEAQDFIRDTGGTFSFWGDLTGDQTNGYVEWIDCKIRYSLAVVAPAVMF